MTSVVPVTLGILAGVCLYGFLRHLFVGLRRPVDEVPDLLFSALCLVVAVYGLLAVALYGATTVPGYTLALHGSIVLGQLFHIVLLWFAASYTRVRPLPLLAVLSLAHVALAVVSVVQPYALPYRQITGIADRLLPWGERIATVTGAPSSTLLMLAYVSVLADIAFIFTACLVRYRRGGQRPSLMLGLAVLGFLAFIGVDLAIHAGAFDFMYVGEFGFLTLVVVMTVGLSREARLKLENANRDLRVEIAERKRVQAALRASEENLRITVDSIGDGVIVTDAEARIARMNPVAEQLTGWSVERALGRGLGEVLQTLDATTGKPAEDATAAVLSGVSARSDMPRLLRARSGTEFHVASTTAPIRSPDGQRVGAVVVVRDMTEQHLLEEKLSQSQKMDALGQLAGGVAHDFNNVLTAIMGYAEVLAEELADRPRDQRRSRSIVEASRRAAELTRKLLTFSRRSPTVFEPVEVHGIVDEVVAMLRRSIDKTITVERELRATTDRIVGDATELQSALLNLGINARDAMPEGGCLRFATCDLSLTEADRRHLDLESVDRCLRVSVSDSGTGIPNAVVDRIFEPFFTTKEPGAGTGLGLSAVYGTVREHEGAVEVETRPGNGTTFHLYFPIAPSDRAIGGKDAEAGQEAKARCSGCVLVVDDEPAVRELARQNLESLGYTVLVAGDGESALDTFRHHGETIDAVVLDMVMPRMSGRQVLEQLRDMRGDVKVLISSGFVADEKIGDLLDQRGVVFLEKPYRRAELARELQRLLA